MKNKIMKYKEIIEQFTDTIYMVLALAGWYTGQITLMFLCLGLLIASKLGDISKSITNKKLDDLLNKYNELMDKINNNVKRKN